MTFLEELKSRGLIHDVSHFKELETLCESKKIVLYCGFDPTADSLHVGSLLPLVMLRRFIARGHTALALVGSATGMIGDPSGKSKERNLLDADLLRHNVECLEAQIRSVLGVQERDCPNFCMVKNGDWLGELKLVSFLRDIGKLFSVNAMLSKDAVKSRIENREQGISYTEFSYLLLQSYDFYHLNKHYGCCLQLGGADQWGNITGGIDLIRRLSDDGEKKAVFGLTFPLLTTSTGAKFGKTETGTVWLDRNRTSPYRFYQFWINTHDNDVITYLRYFSDINTEELEELAELTRTHPEQRAAQKKLAVLLTTLVHGAEEVEKAERASKVLFGGDLSGLSKDTLLDIFAEVPSSEVTASDCLNKMTIEDILVSTGLASSKSQAKRAVEGGGVYYNNLKVQLLGKVVTPAELIDSELLLLRVGKKQYHLVRIT